MSDFDYRLHKIIGVARKKYQGAPHAIIHPLGYQDNNFHFQPFSNGELKDLFLHNGTAFGPKFPDYLVDELIILRVREIKEVDDPAKDVFMADYETKITKYEHTPIVNTNKQGLKEAISQGLYNSYFKVGNRIYYITKTDSEKGIVKYWPVEDGLFETNRNLCRCDDDIYLIRDDINYEFKYSDILSHEEIVHFIIGLIKRYNIDSQDIRGVSDDLMKKMGVPFDILKFRFDEFNELLPLIVLTQENILNLASNPLLSDVLQRSIKEYEDEYIKTYEDHYRETIKKIEHSRTQKLKEIEDECEKAKKACIAQLVLITEEINAKSLKLNEIIDQIRNKEADADALELRFADIEERKSRLIQDFSVIRDVIGSQPQSRQVYLHNSIESVTCHGTPITEFDDFCNHIASHLLKNKFSSESSTELSQNMARLFVAKNNAGKNLGVILLPSLIVFKSLIDAVGQYKLCSVGVGPNWKSFDDLYYNALEGMIISAKNNPNEIHVVLLQNMNLSYIPSYMQPINDIFIGISNKLPGHHNIAGIPSNLWIFGTRTSMNEEAIPISKTNIEEFGCIENKDYTYSEDNSLVAPDCRFITMDFVTSQREEERRYRTFPDSYLD